MTSTVFFTTPVPNTPEIWLGIGDSTWQGLTPVYDNPPTYYSRDVAVDVDWPNVYQYTLAGAIVADNTPLESISGNLGFSPFEYFAKRRAELIGKKVYVIQCAVGGSKIGGTNPAVYEWMVGGALHEGAISRGNAGIAAFKAIDPTAVFRGIVQEMGSNDDSSSLFYSCSKTAIADMDNRLFMNGVSGTKATGNTLHLFVPPRPETCMLATMQWTVGLMSRDLAFETPGGRFYAPEAGYGDLHHFRVGVRRVGTQTAEAMDNRTVSAFSIQANVTVPSGTAYLQEILSSDETLFYWLTGPDAASMEIYRIPYTTISTTVDAARVRHYVRTLGGATHTTGTAYTFVLNAKNGSGIQSASLDMKATWS